MSLKKFGTSDVIRNAMRAYPQSSFFVYSGSVYYNKQPIENGSYSTDVLGASGGASLFEYNIDRAGTTTINFSQTASFTGQNPPIIPYTAGPGRQGSYIKASPRSRTLTEGSHLSFEIIASGPMQEVSDAIARGDTIFTGSSYVMSSSIVRELMSTAGATGSITDVARPVYRHYYGLRNSLDFYGTRSPHYFVNHSSSLIGNWNKDDQNINLISVPKIFYGTRIKPGSVSLKFYITGSLVGELQDKKYNGELIEVTGSNTNAVAGVVMYEEGFVLLTGSWDITDGFSYDFGETTNQTGSWLYFAAGAKDGKIATTSASFDMSFKGHTETQVLTMFAHARRGEANFSNNPTFLDYNQSKISITSSNLYIENDSQTIKNTVSSSYAGHSASFERQVYISRVAVYDDDKKLIGVATLSNPVLKKEAQDLSFKLKLDL
tara:strand:+ start:5735 stop:7036 length:1302 start_codon:yes stop_codon:yes gene_type:complete